MEMTLENAEYLIEMLLQNMQEIHTKLSKTVPGNPNVDSARYCAETALKSMQQQGYKASW